VWENVLTLSLTHTHTPFHAHTLSLTHTLHLLSPSFPLLQEADRVYRTTYMFSATMPPAVERLARKYMRKAIVVNIGRAGQATDNVTQRVLVSGGSRTDRQGKEERGGASQVEWSFVCERAMG
jgi:superfamily II DNA/RNA helicase